MEKVLHGSATSEEMVKRNPTTFDHFIGMTKEHLLILLILKVPSLKRIKKGFYLFIYLFIYLLHLFYFCLFFERLQMSMKCFPFYFLLMSNILIY